jgi:hypothetical protein
LLATLKETSLPTHEEEFAWVVAALEARTGS